ncbi:hypothetical protein COM90_02250 [Bacillus thuringiensis]|uniref:PLL-like beta propeller domain-containing protein n=1 Tax=Bacillus thuringiensis TaxID=1428 RepID=A0AB36TNE5_BACTU|nr:hypothetical protein [Bacillus thuringiensis]PEE61284.1 hypothetical protein COM74_30550 [Bacillus thuringiensis]PEE90433.1 hypothetical protein COM90_02250 [Bacillus thuringiensis]PFM84994.1 hypothetical protein COJ61_28715 [Bacillus thuringiensis]
MTRRFEGLIACSPSTNRVDLFARAENGEVWHRTLFGTTWSTWESLGGQGTVAPAVTVSGDGRIELFAIKSKPAGSEWDLLHKRYKGEQWSDWVSYGRIQKWELPKTVMLAVVATGSDQLEVIFSGSYYDALWHMRLEGDPLEVIQPPKVIEPGPFVSCRQIEAVSSEPGVVELFVRTLGGRDALYRKRFDRTWKATQGVVNPPVLFNPQIYGIAATTKLDVFTVGRDMQLWHQRLTDRQPKWEPLGGQIGDHLTAVSRGSNIDVFAIWNGVALLHRRFDGAKSNWSTWILVDIWPALNLDYSVLRPKDLVNLNVHGVGLKKHVRPDGIVELVPDQADARLIVDFPPQHMGEVVESNNIDARLAGPSRLAFSVSQSESVPLTLPGVLNAIKQLPLLNQANPPTMLDLNKTSIEIPWRLVISPEEKPNCTNLELPGTSAKGITELWHMRLSGPRASGRLYVRPLVALPGNNLNAPLSEDKLNKIVRLGRDPAKNPIAVDRLILSALGGWLSATGNWSEMDWSHETAMGRDYYVRVVTHGTLFPFGHQAVYIEVTERKFDSGKAVLHSEKFLIITENECEYGIGCGGKHERMFPFQRVTIEPRLVTPLKKPDPISVDPSISLDCFWPKWTSGRSVEFSLHAQSGRECVELKLPLLFVNKFPVSAASAEKLINIYNKGTDNVGEPTALVGRTIPLAMKKNERGIIEPVEGASQEVHSMTFGGVATNSDVGFYPKVTGLKVSLPAVRQLLGQKDPIPVTFSDAYVNALPGQQPDVLLDFKGKKLLCFGSAAERTGALAAPDFNVNQISIDKGPILGTINPSPSDLFGPEAKLLGVVKLREIFSSISKPPTLIWKEVIGANTPTATFKWNEKLKNEVIGSFKAEIGSYIDLQVVSKIVAGKPKIETTGVLTNFTLNLMDIVKLEFNELHFSALPDQLPSIRLNIKEVKFQGKLKFVQMLQSLMPMVGPGGPHIDVSSQEIKATYKVSVPTLPLGPVLTLQNLVLETGITLSLSNEPFCVNFAFGKKERPFLATVSMFGGGGYLEMEINADKGLESLSGGLEFGASVAMDFLIAKGEVHVLGGIVFTVKNKSVEIAGYLRIGGSVEVLGLVRLSVELTLDLKYSTNENALIGSAKLVATVDLTFWSTSVELVCQHRIDGASLPFVAETGCVDADNSHTSSVESALGPQGESRPWETYCRAFAWEPPTTSSRK